jgi:hypothetical protein
VISQRTADVSKGGRDIRLRVAMGRFFTRRCIALHMVTLLLVSSFLLAAWWQYECARGGNGLSWAYVFEWPAFAVYAIYMWWQLIHDRHTAFDKLWAAKQHAAADASGTPLYEIPGWALDKALYREVVDASLEAAKSPALSVGQTRAFTAPELGDGQSTEGTFVDRPQVDEWVGDRADGGASPVIDARIVDVKVHVDEELNAYNRYLGELSWRDPPKHWGSGWRWGRHDAARVSGAPVSPPADSIEGQRSELPAAVRDATSEDEFDRR